MGKYYYVSLTSACYEFYDEVREYVDRYSCHLSYATSIKNVKETTMFGDKKSGVLRKILHLIKYGAIFESFPIICELSKDKTGKDIMVDVITNEIFEIRSNDTPSERPKASPILELSASKVREMLETLTKDDIARYYAGSSGIIYKAKIAYESYNERMKTKELEEKEAEKKRIENEEYIDNFRKEHGRRKER